VKKKPAGPNAEVKEEKKKPVAPKEEKPTAAKVEANEEKRADAKGRKKKAAAAGNEKDAQTPKLRKRIGPEEKRAQEIQSAEEETREAILAALIPMPALGRHDSVVQQRRRYIREHEERDPEKHARLKAKVTSHSAPCRYD